VSSTRAALRRVERTRAGAPLGRLVRRVLGRGTGPSYGYVFVVTYGRSGSTLVQGLLNTLPRTVVRGENNFYVHSLYRAWSQVRTFRSKHLQHSPESTTSPFYGLQEIDPASFVSSTRTLVTQHLLGTVPAGEVDVLGFKEVLWHRVRPDETRGFFTFLDRAFPDCRYVLNTRDLGQVAGSGFWQGRDPAHVSEALHRIEDIQAFLRETRPRRTLDVRYELLTDEDREVSDAQLRALAEFVHGECDDDLLAALRKTRETGHGPNPFGRSRGRFEAGSTSPGA
jgi:hypothetical protein